MTNYIEIAAKRNKSVGIILSVLYFFIDGLLSVIVGYGLLFAGSATPLPASATLLGVILVALGILSLGTCYGLWMLMEWGRKLGIALPAIGILVSILVSLMMPEEETTSSEVMLGIANIAITVLIIWYLTRSNVKALFSEAKASAGLQNFSEPSVPISRFCTQCGNRLEAGRRFCPSCGSAAEQ